MSRSIRTPLTDLLGHYFAAAAGDVNTSVVWAGEGIDLIHGGEPAAEIAERLAAEARAALEKAASFSL
ncbi:MAG: hypothetical protein JO128_03740 [Alphaproteobacteria bacterium]|nr:hypothetical protein [Alphaproteobacteria bacterium]